MFVGHYGVSFAANAKNRTVPLWVLFLAVQLLDVFWSIFVLLGIEKVRIIPGFTRTNPLDLYYMPYTHSLFGALGWSILAAVAYQLWRRGSSGSALVGVAVFSHWVLDLVVHVHDLPLFGDRFKVGFGLWNYPALALGLEIIVLLGGLWVYLRATGGLQTRGSLGFMLFAIALIGVQVFVFFGAPPSSPAAAAVTALLSYVVFAALAGWLDARRTRAGVTAS
jgi:hypothetical protein